MARGSSHGRRVQAGLWAAAEFDALGRMHALGLPVPYPVQISGTEVLMEFIGDGTAAAPRLAQTRADGAEGPAVDELHRLTERYRSTGTPVPAVATRWLTYLAGRPGSTGMD